MKRFLPRKLKANTLSKNVNIFRQQYKEGDPLGKNKCIHINDQTFLCFFFLMNKVSAKKTEDLH